MPLSLYWNHLGEPHEIEDCPESIEHWNAGQPLNEPQRTMIQTVEKVLLVQVMQMDVCAMCPQARKRRRVRRAGSMRRPSRSRRACAQGGARQIGRAHV